MPYVNCANCDKEIYRQPYQLKSTKRFYCDRKCWSEWMKKNWVGENSIAYKGKPPQKFTCDQCGKEFFKRLSEIGKREHKFCSRKCKNQWQRENKINQHLKRRIIANCKNCGKEVERIPAHARSENIFCSKHCRDEWRSIHWIGENSPFWKGSNEMVICDICGKSFERHKSEVNKRENHFCSHRCYSIWKSQQTGEKSPKWKGGEQKLKCSQCGKEIVRVYAQAKRSKNFFCSRECRSQWQSANVVGPNHHLWRGGWQPYYGPSWKYQRRNARKRDNFTCQHCGMTEGESIRVYNQKLHIHHIKPFMEFGYIEGQNDNDKKANSLKNLITLCQTCHYKIEWEYRHSI